jgi:hypothetical protein
MISFSRAVLRCFTQRGGTTPLGVFYDAFADHKMRVHFLTASGILIIWGVTHPSTIRAQRCLTLVITWILVCPTWQDAVLEMIVHIASFGILVYVVSVDDDLVLLSNSAYTVFTTQKRPLLPSPPFAFLLVRFLPGDPDLNQVQQTFQVKKFLLVFFSQVRKKLDANGPSPCMYLYTCCAVCDSIFCPANLVKA